jgi:hypothetical protein
MRQQATFAPIACITNYLSSRRTSLPEKQSSLLQLKPTDSKRKLGNRVAFDRIL